MTELTVPRYSQLSVGECKAARDYSAVRMSAMKFSVADIKDSLLALGLIGDEED